MSVEIHQPEIEALIEERQSSGTFENVEEVLIHALRSAPFPIAKRRPKKDFVQFLMDSPLPGSGLDLERV